MGLRPRLQAVHLLLLLLAAQTVVRLPLQTHYSTALVNLDFISICQARLV